MDKFIKDENIHYENSADGSLNRFPFYHENDRENLYSKGV
jgi:hypothetical protein